MDCQAAQQSRDTLGEVDRKLRLAVAQFETLAKGIAPKLSDAEQGDLTERMAAISEQVDGALSRLQLMDAAPMSVIATLSPKLRIPTHSQRYLGEVSDVRFFNLVERVLQDKNVAAQTDEGMDSYEQDDLLPRDAPLPEVAIELPSPEIADELLDVYFSTVHVAYPFLQKSIFMSTYKNIRDGGSTKDVDSSWISLLCRSSDYSGKTYLLT